MLQWKEIGFLGDFGVSDTGPVARFGETPTRAELLILNSQGLATCPPDRARRVFGTGYRPF